MNTDTQNNNNNNNLKPTLLALLFSFTIAIASTLIIYCIDMWLRLKFLDEITFLSKIRMIVAFWEQTDIKNQFFYPLDLYQFYGILLFVVFGLVAGLLFYTDKKEGSVEEISEFRTKMEKKKLKKATKTKVKS